MVNQVMDEERRDFRARQAADHQRAQRELQEKRRQKESVIQALAMGESAEVAVQAQHNAVADGTATVAADGTTATNRGPSLLIRLSQYKKRLAKMEEDTDTDVFGEPLDQLYDRARLLTLLDNYDDPCVLLDFISNYFASTFIYYKYRI